jgi:hypothetical protein
MIGYFRFFKVVVLCFFLGCELLYAVPPGSESLISTAPGGAFTAGYQGVQLAFNDGKIVRGHFMFKDGIVLNNFATLTWDADGILHGQISAANARAFLALNNDLHLGSTASFDSTRMGFEGNNHIVYFSNDMAMVGNSFYCLVSSLSPIIFDGQGNTLTMIGVANGAAAFFGVDKNTGSGAFVSSLTLRNMTIKLNNNFQNYAFLYITQLVLQDMTLIEMGTGDNLSPDASLLPNILIKGNVYVEGVQGCVLDFKGAAITIDKHSTLHIGKGVVAVNIGGITMTDASSTLHLNGCDLYTGCTGLVPNTIGMTLTKGNVFFENKARIFNTDQVGGVINTDMSQGFILGDGTAVNDVNVRVLGGAYVTVNGCMEYNHS